MGEWSDWCRMHNNDEFEEYTRSHRAVNEALEKLKSEYSAEEKLVKIKRLYAVTDDFETVYHSVWDIVNGR